MTVDTAIAWPDNTRRLAFERWLGPLCEAHALDVHSLAPASADASFRRYFRLRAGAGSLIVMDAPPPLEDVRPFIDVAQRLQYQGFTYARLASRHGKQQVLAHRHVGEQQVVLKQHADPAGLWRQPVDAGAGQLHRAVKVQAFGQGAAQGCQQAGFARAAGPHQGVHAARRHTEPQGAQQHPLWRAQGAQIKD